MKRIPRRLKHVGLVLALAAGIGGFAPTASARHMTYSSRSVVMQAQDELRDEGYYRGRIDGTEGSRFQAALRNYQRDNGLRITGQLDRATVSSLGVNH